MQRRHTPSKLQENSKINNFPQQKDLPLSLPAQVSSGVQKKKTRPCQNNKVSIRGEKVTLGWKTLQEGNFFQQDSLFQR